MQITAGLMLIALLSELAQNNENRSQTFDLDFHGSNVLVLLGMIKRFLSQINPNRDRLAGKLDFESRIIILARHFVA